jgi:hypothetical protein
VPEATAPPQTWRPCNAQFVVVWRADCTSGPMVGTGSGIGETIALPGPGDSGTPSGGRTSSASLFARGCGGAPIGPWFSGKIFRTDRVEGEV